MYTKQLPEVRQIASLSRQVEHYPTYAHNLQAIARRQAYDEDVQDFLELFPDDEMFETGDDLVNRCEELEMFIREERDSPQEFLRSP